MSRPLLATALAALLLGGCALTNAGDAARQDDAADLRADLVADGMDEAVVDCFLGSLQDQDVDLDTRLSEVDGQLDALIEAVAPEWAVAGRECLVGEARQQMLDDLDVEAFRDGFVSGFVGTNSATREQAGCVFDRLVADGVEPAALSGQLSAETAAAIAAAREACGVTPPDLTTMPVAEVRRQFVAGFTAASGADRDQATCVFDGMLGRGHEPVAFAGDTIAAAAEADLDDVFDECGIAG